MLSASAQTGPAAGGWATLGAMAAPSWDGKSFMFRSGQGMLAIRALSGDVVRVRFTRGRIFGRDHSYAGIN